MAKQKSQKQSDSSDYQEYLQSEHWKRVARVTKELAGNQCVLCSSMQSLNAHHNPSGYKNLNQEIPGRDTVCLCQKCHEQYHKINKEEAEIRDLRPWFVGVVETYSVRLLSLFDDLQEISVALKAGK